MFTPDPYITRRQAAFSQYRKRDACVVMKIWWCLYYEVMSLRHYRPVLGSSSFMLLNYLWTWRHTMTERADQLHHDNAPVHSTALVHAFYGKTSHHPGLSAPLQPRFGSLWLLTFPIAKIAVEREDICECDSHTEHKLSQWRLTADWLAPQVTVHGCTVRSPLTGCQVTSRPRDRFSRYSKWLDTFRIIPRKGYWLPECDAVYFGRYHTARGLTTEGSPLHQKWIHSKKSNWTQGGNKSCLRNQNCSDTVGCDPTEATIVVKIVLSNPKYFLELVVLS